MNNQIQMDDNPYSAPQTPMFNEPQAEKISLGWWFWVHLGIRITGIVFFPITLIAVIVAIYITDNKSKKNYFIAYLLKFVILIPIAVLVVIVLAAIMPPSYQDYNQKQLSEVTGIKTAITEAYIEG